MAQQPQNQQQNRDAEVAEQCRLAFVAEHQARFVDASQQHQKAIVALTRLADDASFFDRERKRVARKQVKFHAARIEVLRPIINGQKSGLDVVLPSSLSATESLQRPNSNGGPALSLDELLLGQVLAAHDKQTKPAISEITSQELTKANYNIKQAVRPILDRVMSLPPADLSNPTIRHLFPLNADGTQGTPPFYSPTLNKSAPESVYHVYMSTESMMLSGVWICYKVKNASDGQTLYVLQANKRRHYQIPSTTLSRATEFTTPCVITAVEPVQNAYSNSMAGLIGRTLTHHTASPNPVIDRPDRWKHVKWAPRRFEWGGRKFVWTQGGADGRSTKIKLLSEIKRQWPQPGSKTGKMQHECFEPIVQVDTKIAIKKVATVAFRYGTADDQLFRELVLASVLTELVVSVFGHRK